MLDLFLLISTKVYITQPIEWRLEKSEQPIREVVEFETLRAN